MMNPIPVIMVHYGDSGYLADAISQAIFAQKGGRVILLGDEENAHYEGVDHYPLESYFREATCFAEKFKLYRLNVYQHRWQMFCFQRWMCLREFMKAHGIERCFTMDSDVLLYEPANEIAERYREFEITVLEKTDGSLCANGAISVVNSRSMLDALIELMFEMFGQTELHETVKRMSDGITDMTALGFLRKRYPHRVGNAFYPKDKTILDHCVLESDGFAMDGERKLISWIEGVPYGCRGAQRDLIRFGAIHFHGHAKKVMHKYTSHWPNALRAQRNRNAIRFQCLKAAGKMARLLTKFKEAGSAIFR
jgi:hypothetical protein